MSSTTVPASTNTEPVSVQETHKGNSPVSSPSWTPYAQLARVDKPAACLYLYLPCFFGTALAASVSDKSITSHHLLRVNLIFALGSFLVRCAGCTWNDIVDQDVDRKVLRTKHRPLARGAISTSNAVVFCVFQVLIGLWLVHLLLPGPCLHYSAPSIFLTWLYPYSKLFTNYPQFVLGCVFSWGVIIAFPALGTDLFASTESIASASCLYGSCIAWTLGYDTIYAAQDAKDDLKAGIGSPVARHQGNTRTLLWAFALIQVILLYSTGVAMNASLMFYIGSCVGTAVALVTTIIIVDLSDPKDCSWWFRRGSLATGAAVGSGLFIEFCSIDHGHQSLS